MNDQYRKAQAEKILQSICEGKEALLALGRELNQTAIANKGEGAFMREAYQALGERINGIESIFDARDHFMLSQVNRLPWSREERRRFFQAYYADDVRHQESDFSGEDFI